MEVFNGAILRPLMCHQSGMPFRHNVFRLQNGILKSPKEFWINLRFCFKAVLKSKGHVGDLKMVGEGTFT